MPALDPSGFQMSAVIVSGGKRYPLWLTPQGDSPGAMDELTSGMPILESVDIEMSLGLASKVTAQIAAPFDMGMRILESGVLRIGNVLEVQIGYPRIGRFMPWISSMMAQPSIKISPDEGLTATLNGEGGAFAALRGSRSSQYANTTYADIIRQLGESETYGFVVDLPDRSGGDDPLYQQRESVSQSNQSDWFFIQWITRASNCDCWLQPSREQAGRQVLKVARRRVSLGAAPRFTFVMRGKSDFDTLFPIFEWESNAEGIWLPPAATSVRSVEVNPDTLEVTELLATPQTTDVPATGEAVPADTGARVEDTMVRLTPPRDGETSGEMIYTSPRDPRGVEAVAEAHRTESSMRGGVEAQLTTIGIPDIFPNDMVGVANFGPFDGLYLIKKSTHRCSSSEWGMTLELLNNATTQDFLAEALRGFAPIVNEETTPVPSGDAEGGGLEIRPEVEGS